jgi:membrane protein DedA with SNARE-associated domain
MTDILAYLLKHSYSVLFLAVLADHLGLPLPATPFLLAAGAVAQAEGASLTAALLVTLLASLAAHSVWYEAGRRGGRRILKLVCRIALEPDACVRRTENAFGRYGVKALLIAPFVPGLGTVARPMAAMLGVSFAQFIVFAVAGAAIWAASFLLLGYALGHELVEALNHGAALGGKIAAGGAALILAYFAWKLLRRRAVLRSLQTARIQPQELRRRLASGERITVVDLRHPQDVQLDPRKIPGALRILPEELEHRHAEIPREAEVVLYCS